MSPVAGVPLTTGPPAVVPRAEGARGRRTLRGAHDDPGQHDEGHGEHAEEDLARAERLHVRHHARGDDGASPLTASTALGGPGSTVGVQR